MKDEADSDSKPLLCNQILKGQGNAKLWICSSSRT